MTDKELLIRISTDPAVLSGKPVVAGTRLSVEFIVNLLAHGSTAAEIIDEYDGLTDHDIQACLLFAANSLANASFMPLASESS